jgi:O-antigen ligase
VKGKFFIGFHGMSQVFAVGLLVFTVLSTAWSSVPLLSGSKSIMFLLVALVYSSAGALWMRYAPRKNAMDVLWPLALLGFVAGAGGAVDPRALVSMNETVQLYRGLAFNSNFLGMLLMGALPLPLWRMSQPKISTREKWFYYVILVGMLQLLMSTFSRASMLGAGILIAFYIMGRGVSRFMLTFLALPIMLFAAPAIFPEQTVNLVAQYVYKGSDPDAGVLASREEAWNASYEGAIQGGLLGLGYGVSYGYSDFSLGLASSDYGREKANLFLAIVEESGIVGLVLFVGMLLSLLRRGLAATTVVRSANDRILLFLLAGYIVALTVHAQFEAWMYSPGGALTPVFWAAAGMLTRLRLEVFRTRSAHIRAHRDALQGSPSATSAQLPQRLPNA